MTVDNVMDSEKRKDTVDRREIGERRLDEIFFGDADHRIIADRRHGSRRKLTCGILFSTPGAVGQVEDWLDEHCKGDWSLNIENMDDDLIKKSLKILFELETDKQRFVTAHIA